MVEGGLAFGTSVAKLDRDVISHLSGKTATVGIRPEDLVVAKDGKGLSVEVDVVEELGADGYLYGHAEVNGQRVDVVVRVDGRDHPEAGETIVVVPAPEHIHAFDGETGERLTKPIDVTTTA